jgi:hypothetical protein
MELVTAGQMADVGGPDPRLRITLDEHRHELTDLVHVVARLPLGDDACEDVTGGGQGVQRPNGNATLIALMPRDAEVAELQPPLLTHKDVERRQVAVQHLPTMELPEDLEDAGNLAARRGFGPRFARTLQEGAEITEARVFESKTVERTLWRPHQWKRLEHLNRARVSLE